MASTLTTTYAALKVIHEAIVFAARFPHQGPASDCRYRGNGTTAPLATNATEWK